MSDPLVRYEQARQHAENGELELAAALFEEVLALGDVPQRAQAALGLAVVREDAGDVRGARAADLIAIGTEDPEYGPRAAYHLALSCERTGDRAEAADAWRRVVAFGNPAYLPPAQLALAQHADDEGDTATARTWWERVIAGADEQYAPIAAHDLAHRLLEQGATGEAQRLVAGALRLVDAQAQPYAYARLAVTMGMAHLDQAIAAFAAALDDIAGDAAPLAIELLARTLPLRGRMAEAREVWAAGLSDPATAAQVRARLRREFGETEAEGLWWECLVESAVGQGAVPALTGEVFGALDHMYSLIALRYAEGPEGLPADAYDALGEAVRVPSEYPWGATLHRSFTERLREAMGARAPVLQEGWPEG